MPELPLLPPIADQSLSIVLLACNDAPHLDGAVSSWLSYLNGLGRDFEILLVHLGSQDATGPQAVKLAQRSNRIQLLQREQPMGEGEGLQMAFAHASRPLLFYTRCKPWYTPAGLRKMLVEPRAHRPDGKGLCPEIELVHLSVGYRAFRPVPRLLRGLGSLWRLASWALFSAAPSPLPGWLGWRQHLAQTLFRLVYGLRSGDAFCPYRLLRRDILARIPVQSRGAFAHVEILAKANFLQLLIGEDIPLGDRRGRNPVSPLGEEHSDTFGQMLADFKVLLTRPDFGPALVPSWRQGEKPFSLPEEPASSAG